MRLARLVAALAIGALLVVPSSAVARTGDSTLDAAGASALCQDIFDGMFPSPSTEPLAACHAAGVAALIIQQHPGWRPSAVASALQRTATPLACPSAWEPQFDGDARTCTGGASSNSFFGKGIVDALKAAH